MGELGRAREERLVRGVSARPSALDIVDTEHVDFPRDADLVRDREVDPLRLRAVAQGGVVEPDPLAGHARRQSVVPSGRSSRIIPRSCRASRSLSADAKSFSARYLFLNLITSAMFSSTKTFSPSPPSGRISYRTTSAVLMPPCRHRLGSSRSRPNREPEAKIR